MIQVPTVPLGLTLTLDFVTHLPSTGASSNADSTPTCEVFEDATDVAILTPTCVIRALKTGDYRVQVACTVANGFELGKSYNVIATAIVSGYTAKAVIATFVVGPAFYYGSVVANGANTSSTFKTDRTESTNDHWKDAVLVFVSGSLAGQAKGISSYTGATVFASFTEAFTAAPSAGDLFVLIPIARLTVAETQSGLATSAAQTTIQGKLPSVARTTGAVVANGSNSATTFKTGLSQTTNDHWKDALLTFTSGTLAGQVKKITAYDGTTKFVTFTSGFTGAPSAADTFDIVNE